MSQAVICFVFGGRRANMELQLPFISRILAENPNVEYHVWNLARTEQDSAYLQTIKGERITVFNGFRGSRTGFDDVFRNYADPAFTDHLFVKLDDDIVFIETDRFGEFIAAIDGNRDQVISAKVINNGACTITEPALWDVYLDRLGEDLPLLDVHMSAAYAIISHNYMFEKWPHLVRQQIKLIATADWLSINLIGYDWQMGRRIAGRLGTPSPAHIAGRDFGGNLGDEGTVNTLPRMILHGFLACHLYFGPQAKALPDDRLTRMREHYATIAGHYLARS